jgi:hypothetical protein
MPNQNINEEVQLKLEEYLFGLLEPIDLATKWYHKPINRIKNLANLILRGYPNINTYKYVLMTDAEVNFYSLDSQILDIYKICQTDLSTIDRVDLIFYLTKLTNNSSGLSYCQMLLEITRFRLRKIDSFLASLSPQEKQQIAIHEKLK